MPSLDMQAKISLHKGLEPLAIALILAPEPATTVIGIGLLAYARTQHYLQAREKGKVRRRVCPAPAYAYKMKLVRGETIVYQCYTKYTGQLPAAGPVKKGMYYTPVLWNAYCQHTCKRIDREKAPRIPERPVYNISKFKRPAAMPANVHSYRMPPLYRTQPAVAAARV